MTLRTIQQSRILAEARCAAYALIACGFRYPDRDLLKIFSDAGRWTSWPKVLADAAPTVAAPLAAVRNRCVSLSLENGSALAHVQEAHLGLFGHAVRGKCPPYELEYGRSEIIQQAGELADLGGFYAAFGLEIADPTDRRPDGLWAECEFMAVLCDKEGHCEGLKRSRPLEITRQAQRSFFHDHLAPWVPAFAYRVKQADGGGFYGDLAVFTDAWVAAEAARFDVPVGPRWLELRPADPIQDASIECGAADPQDDDAARPLVQVGIATARR